MGAKPRTAYMRTETLTSNEMLNTLHGDIGRNRSSVEQINNLDPNRMGLNIGRLKSTEELFCMTMGIQYATEESDTWKED